MGLLSVGFSRAYIECGNVNKSRVVYIYEEENLEISIIVFVNIEAVFLHCNKYYKTVLVKNRLYANLTPLSYEGYSSLILKNFI